MSSLSLLYFLLASEVICLLINIDPGTRESQCQPTWRSHKSGSCAGELWE